MIIDLPESMRKSAIELAKAADLLADISTAELQAELSRREGVISYVFGPEDNVLIANGSGVMLDESGPIIVTVNVD